MKKTALVLLLILAGLLFAACGGGGSTTPTAEEPNGGANAGANAGAEGEGKEPKAAGGAAGAAGKVEIEANPEGQLAFEEKEVTAKAGTDTVDLTNQSPVPHNVAIEDSSGKVIGETETLSEGSTSTVVDLKPGTYTFFCSIPGHREAGMEGTLVVK